MLGARLQPVAKPVLQSKPRGRRAGGGREAQRQGGRSGPGRQEGSPISAPTDLGRAQLHDAGQETKRRGVADCSMLFSRPEQSNEKGFLGFTGSQEGSQHGGFKRLDHRLPPEHCQHLEPLDRGGGLEDLSRWGRGSDVLEGALLDLLHHEEAAHGVHASGRPAEPDQALHTGCFNDGPPADSVAFQLRGRLVVAREGSHRAWNGHQRLNLCSGGGGCCLEDEVREDRPAGAEGARQGCHRQLIVGNLQSSQHASQQPKASGRRQWLGLSVVVPRPYVAVESLQLHFFEGEKFGSGGLRKSLAALLAHACQPPDAHGQGHEGLRQEGPAAQGDDARPGLPGDADPGPPRRGPARQGLRGGLRQSHCQAHPFRRRRWRRCRAFRPMFQAPPRRHRREHAVHEDLGAGGGGLRGGELLGRPDEGLRAGPVQGGPRPAREGARPPALRGLPDSQGSHRGPDQRVRPENAVHGPGPGDRRRRRDRAVPDHDVEPCVGRRLQGREAGAFFRAPVGCDGWGRQSLGPCGDPAGRLAQPRRRPGDVACQ
mmetsp:Transcript_75306/g.220821  ORF Transcript_75306/g.220821 Transcript_75306/m.220821 type:complete len:542 (-) Transcript_75306:8-1633(-)